MSRFIDITLPEIEDLESVCTVVFSTNVLTMYGSGEWRNSERKIGLKSYILNYSLLSVEAYIALTDFFKTVKGRANSFRFKDADEYRATEQKLGAIGKDGKSYQLLKRDGVAPATKPRLGTIQIRVDGQPLKENLDFSVDYLLGVVTFKTMPVAQPIASFEFDTEVRFDTDACDIEKIGFEIYRWRNVGLKEVV